jgi:hypothetical protein
MALGCGLTSVRGNRGKNYENEQLVPQKHTKKKKNIYKKAAWVSHKGHLTEKKSVKTPGY